MKMAIGYRSAATSLLCTGLALIISSHGSTALAAAADEGLPDTEVRLATEYQLIMSPAVPAHLVDVEVKNGIATLSGRVDSLLAKDRAAEIAQTIRGVSSVVNAITVQPPAKPDEEIEKNIQRALAQDPATDLYEIDVQVADATAILKGQVDSLAERHLAEEVAKGVVGLKAIKNDVVAKPSVKRSETEIAADVKRLLEQDPWIDAQAIEVSAKDDTVYLSGRVRTPLEYQYAINDAWVRGVMHVDSKKLEVAKTNMKPLVTEPISDKQIEQLIQTAINHHPRLASFDVKVGSDDHIVTLVGQVDNFKAKNVAAEIAQNTRGVTKVRNHLKVRPDKIPEDLALAKEIKQALVRDPYVSRYDFNVAVYNAKAYLNGRVDSSFEKTWAEDIASRVPGLVDVKNNLRVVDMEIPQKTDWELKQDIEDTLRWNAFVDPAGITVAVENGVAVLSGSAESWRAKLAANRASRLAGAESVLNNVQVRDETATAGPGYIPRGPEKIVTKLTKAQMKIVEEKLKSKGYDPGNIDGVLDDKTQAAIRSFQKDIGISATGNIDERTAEELGIFLAAQKGK